MSINGVASGESTIKGRVSGSQSLSASANKTSVIKGESAYQLAVLNGFEGTEAEWLESLHGRDGKSVNVDTYYETDEGTVVMFSDGTEVLVRKGEDGKSAYEYAKEKGYDGTEEEFAEMLANAGSGGGGGIIEETDPTVPSWAKQANKPTYTKTEIGLGNVDNVRQYSANNPPPYPVTSVNGKTGAVTVSVPTKTSQMTNDSGFITKAVSDLANYYLKSETLTKTEINALVSAIPKFAISVVSSLPTSNISETTVYLVKSGTSGDLYTEYIRVNNAWEVLGSQKVDLTGYAKLTDIPTKMSELDNDIDYAQLDDIPPAEVYVGDGDMPEGATVQFILDDDDIPGIDIQEIVDAVLAALPRAEGVGF